MNIVSVISIPIFLLTVMILPAGNAWSEASGRQIQESSARVLSLQDAVRTALDNNPDIKALNARYMAATNIPPQVGSLPDPVLSFNALNLPTDTFSLDQEAMTQMQVKLVQAIPFPGKLSMKETAAGKEAESLKFQVDELRLRVASQVESAWWVSFI